MIRHSYKPVKISRSAIFFFVLGALALDVNFPRIGFKTGNLVLIFCLGLSFFFHCRANDFRLCWPRLGIASKIYLCYLTLALLSALWAPSAGDTVFQVLILFIIWFSAVLISYAPPQLFIRYVAYVGVIAAILSIAMMAVSSKYAYQPISSSDRRELRGIFEHQLRLGLFAGSTLAVMGIAWLNKEVKKVFPSFTLLLVFAPIVALACFLAYARLYTLFVILAFLLTYFFSKGRFIRWISSIGILVVVVLAIIFQGNFESTLADAGIDTTLTGRVRIWTLSLEEARTSPWLGHGYASFDAPIYDSMWGVGIYRPPHPHNSYIQAFFENGYLGFALILLLSIVHFRLAAYPEAVDGRFSYSLFFITLLILGSLTGANYAAKPATLFCLALWLITAKETRGRMRPLRLTWSRK